MVSRNAPGDPTNYRALLNNATTAMSVLKDVIASHKKRLDENPDAERRDFVDLYLDKIRGGEPTCTGRE